MVLYKRRSRRTLANASRIAATEAAKTFGGLVDRVREERAVYIIERGGTPVAQIGPVATAVFTLGDFKTMLRDLPGPDEEYLRAVESVVKSANKPRVPRDPWAR